MRADEAGQCLPPFRRSFESRRGTRAALRDSYALYGFASSTERLCEQDQVAVVAVM